MNGVPVSCGVYSLCQKDSAAGRTSGYAFGMQKMSADDGARAAVGGAGWEMAGDAIRRQYTFSGLPRCRGLRGAACVLLPRLRITIPTSRSSYKRVTLTYSTHSAGGLTEKDFAGAKEADRLAASGIGDRAAGPRLGPGDWRLETGLGGVEQGKSGGRHATHPIGKTVSRPSAGRGIT
jgi:4a-hydroxytetrahydrobiopterin dehydratase